MDKIAEIKVSYSSNMNKKIAISNSNQVYKLIIQNWDMDIIEFQEIVKVIFLNRSNVILGILEASKGGISGTVVDIKNILSVALKSNASGLILIHNHPSGNLNPSTQDMIITKKLLEACNQLDLKFQDHLIITKEGYYSFRDTSNIFND